MPQNERKPTRLSDGKPKQAPSSPVEWFRGLALGWAVGTPAARPVGEVSGRE